MTIVKKIVQTLKREAATRGLYHTILMNLSYLLAFTRGYFYKCIYFKNIHSSLFALQANSKIEIFNKNSRIIMGKFVFMRKNVSVRIDFDGQLFLGEKVFINDNCNINCVNKISIGKHTKIAPNVCINDHDHNYKNVSNQHLVKGEVIIGENVWIGSNVVILRNTHIGNNAVIGAGSVVKGNVPANTLFLNKKEEKLLPFFNSKEKRSIL
ncbi:acyltransferase [Domibacillus sp.]|uniref:acyltransferase n=1 Tax=Domibacillus sp. TaxID=1969783 RepID=UPI0028122DD3|nr:acyltransferase [Domibacillus sp.]